MPKNWNFFAKEMEYLTKDGMKPKTNVVHVILALRTPKGGKDFQRFLGMIPY